MKKEKNLLEINKSEELAKQKVEEPEEIVKPRDEIQDISLNLNKQKFRIDNDSNRILEIDTSDLGVVARLNEYYPKLKELEQDIAKFSVNPDDSDEATIKKMGEGLKKVDAKMREYLDKIFDANVSQVCAPWGTMYDPVNGQLRYEQIISIISGLYEKNLASETRKIKAKISKYTNKYTR